MFRTISAALATSCLVAVATPAAAQDQAFNVPAGSLQGALDTFAKQSGRQIIYKSDDINEARSKGVHGSMRAEVALRTILRGTSFAYRSDNGVFAIYKADGADARLVAGPNVGDGDILVVAQRRAEPISRTPVAVTAVEGQAVAEQVVSTIDALENVVPSLTLNQGGQAATGGFRIRGVGTETFSGGIEPSVATFVDGVIIGKTTNVTNQQLIDLDRVEVLRGPQGTLFGKNASAGVVNIITKGPTRNFQVGGSATIAERGTYNVQTYLSGPLSDTLSFRLTGYAAGHDGYIRNTVPNAYSLWQPLLVAQPNLLNGINLVNSNAFYQLRAFGVRGKLRFETSAINSLLTLEYGDSKGDCCVRTFTTFYPNGAGLNRRLYGADIGPESTSTAEDALVPTIDRSFSAILDNTIHLGGGYDLVTLSGFRRLRNASIEDQDYGTGPQITGSTAFFNKAEFDYRSVVTRQFSQEIRLQSPVRRPLAGDLSFDFVLGGYYYHQTDDYGPGNTRIQIINNTVPPFAWCSTPACRRDFVYTVLLKSENVAAFGQANLHVGPVTLFYGGRFTHDRISYDWASQDDPVAPFRQGTFTRSERGSKSNYSQRAGAEFEASPTLFFYGSYAEGYKGPGFRTFERIGSEEFLQPEYAKSYELGTRIRFPQYRTFIGLTLFREDYRNLTVSGYDQLLKVSRIFNAGGARSQGVELDLNSRPLDGLTIVGGFAYSDNKYTNFPGTSCYPFQTVAQGCVFDVAANRSLQNLVGAPLQRAPAFKFNLSAKYELPDFGPVRPYVSANYRHFSSQQMGGNNDPKTIQPAYGILDMSVGISTFNDSLDLKIFAKNVLDQFYAVNIFSTDNWLNQRFPIDYGRYFGLTLTVHK